MRIPIIAIACLFVASTASAAIVEHHLYTPTSLPSAQGWTYQSTGLNEEAVFEIVDDLLVMDTMGAGFGGESLTYYLREFTNVAAQSAVLRLRVRLTDYQHDPVSRFLGFTFGGQVPSWGSWIIYGLQIDAVYTNREYLQDLDTSAWHEYTVVTEGNSQDSQSTLLIDGVEVFTMAGGTDSMINNTFVFGDMGRHANARVEISEIEITTFDGDPVEVERVSLSDIKARYLK